MPVRLAPPIHLSLFQTYNPAQHFHGVAADANVGDALTVARCAHKHFTGSSSFDALADENLLTRFRKAMAHDPTDRTARRCSGGGIFSSIKKHPRAHFSPGLEFFRTNKIKKAAAGSFENGARSNKIRLQACETFQITNRHNHERKSGRHDLAWPFGRDFVAVSSKNTSDLLSRQCESKLRVALAHLTKNISR